MDRRTLADRLTKMREAAGFTQDEIAERLGIKQPTVSAYESARNEPALERIEAWAKECGFTLRMEFPRGDAAKPLSKLMSAAAGLDPKLIELLTELASNIEDTTPTHREIMQRLAKEDAEAARRARSERARR